MKPVPWLRPKRVPTDLNADLMFFCFADHDLLAGMGKTPFELPEGYETHRIARSDDRQTFDELLGPGRQGRLTAELHLDRELASKTLGATWLYTVEGASPNPPDLEYLRAAVRAVQWYATHGAFAIYDYPRRAWMSAAQALALPLDGPFEPADHFELIFETDPSREGHLVFSRGMEKFGRPELIIADVQPSEKELAQLILGTMGKAAALGDLFRDGEQVQIPGAPPALVVGPERFPVYELEQPVLRVRILRSGTGGARQPTPAGHMK
jgi:hypothetical protein